VPRGPRARRWLGLALLACLLAPAPALSLPDGLARTPPMGWNPWYGFRCRVDEALVRSTADAMVTSGMRAAGYRYVNLDDCWMAGSRLPSGELRADPARFPSGIRALADYVHARGLKLGIYQSPGARTCAGYPGMRGHFLQDARTFAAWRIDYLKLDWCRAAADHRAPAVYAALRYALRRSGRPMVVSISNWGRQRVWRWGPLAGHLWRTTLDVSTTRPWPVLLRFIGYNERLAPFAGPGAWNDPDILQVGNPRLTAVEQQAIFSLWSIMAATLVAGNDLRSMSPVTRRILTNREVIAVDQDRLGRQGVRLRSVAGREVWARRLAGGHRALVLFNRRPNRSLLTWDARRLGIGRSGRFRVRNLWTHRTAYTGGPIRMVVPRHGVGMLRVTRVSGRG
jgi:alpha-galactosidase